MGGSTWRSLHSVMLVTLHVAVVAAIFRSLGRPTTLSGSFVFWVPLTILFAVFLSWPLGRALSAAFQADPESGMSRCGECGTFDLRPLLRSGAGLFGPVAGYRCPRCGVTYRVAEGGIIVERPIMEVGTGEDSGIEFLFEVPRPGDREGIRFLDEDPADPA